MLKLQFHLFIVALLLAGRTAALELEPCQLTAAKGLVVRQAHCATLLVAEDPANPRAREIPLRIAVFKARSGKPLPDPVFFFAGGPGQSALESFPAALAALESIRKERDIVLIDQRGTGQSNPLRCPLPEDVSELLRTPTAPEVERATLDCLEQLQGDTRFYTTGIAAADFDAVRKALGYDKINLLGVSYGTRMAQVYLRHYPQAVRTVILDGVVPTDLVLGSEHAQRLEETLHAIFARCAQEENCNQAFPRLEQQFRNLEATITRQPVSIEVPMPLGGQRQQLKFDRGVLAAVLRILAYTPESQALVPLLVYEAATQQNYQRLAAMALMILESLDQTIYRGLEASVMCAEDVPLFPEPPQHPDTLMGDSLLRIARQQCRLWPRGSVPADFHTPFASPLPVLLLSGEYDPVTPPEYGDRALQQYVSGRHLTAAGQGHGVAGRGCMPKVLQQFVSSGSADELEIECLDNLGGSAFFTTLLGSEP